MGKEYQSELLTNFMACTIKRQNETGFADFYKADTAFHDFRKRYQKNTGSLEEKSQVTDQVMNISPGSRHIAKKQSPDNPHDL